MQDSNHIFFDELSIIFSEERLDGYVMYATNTGRCYGQNC